PSHAVGSPSAKMSAVEEAAECLTAPQNRTQIQSLNSSGRELFKDSNSFFGVIPASSNALSWALLRCCSTLSLPAAPSCNPKKSPNYRSDYPANGRYRRRDIGSGAKFEHGKQEDS